MLKTHCLLYIHSSFSHLQLLPLHWSSTRWLEAFLYCCYSPRHLLTHPRLLIIIPSLFPLWSDHHPISLLSLISKVFECNLFDYLLKHITTQNFLSDGQFGFHPGFSTETAQLYTTKSCLSSLDSNKSTCAVFLDMKKCIRLCPTQAPPQQLVISQHSLSASVLALFLPHNSHTKCYTLWL